MGIGDWGLPNKKSIDEMKEILNKKNDREKSVSKEIIPSNTEKQPKDYGLTFKKSINQEKNSDILNPNFIEKDDETNSDFQFLGVASKSRISTERHQPFTLCAVLVPHINSENFDFDPLDFINAMPKSVNILQIDIPYNLTTFLFMDRIFFTVQSKDEFDRIAGKSYYSKEYKQSNSFYYIDTFIPTYDEMKRLKMGNNLEPEEYRYWVDFTGLKNEFDYREYFYYMKLTRGFNIIEYVSLNFRNGVLSYAHFNFKKSSLKYFAWDKEKKCYHQFHNGDLLYFKPNTNKRERERFYN